MYEISQRRLRLIPTEAAAPAMKARTLKMLGTPTCDAQELAAEALFSIDEVKLAAIAESARLEEAGFTDRVQATQPQVTPHLSNNEPNNEEVAHCKSSLFNNEGTWAHCWNNEQGSLCHKSQ